MKSTEHTMHEAIVILLRTSQVVVRVFLDVLEETDRAKEFFECLERWLSSPVDVYNMVCYKY